MKIKQAIGKQKIINRIYLSFNSTSMEVKNRQFFTTRVDRSGIFEQPRFLLIRNTKIDPCVATGRHNRLKIKTANEPLSNLNEFGETAFFGFWRWNA